MRTTLTLICSLVLALSLLGVSLLPSEALEEAEVSGFHFHNLRHCAATNLRRANVDTTTAMQIVGHTLPQMWKRYNHIQEEDLTHAANTLGKYLQRNTPGTLDETAEKG